MTHGATMEARAVTVPESWLDRVLGTKWDEAPRPPGADKLAAHGAVTTREKANGRWKIWFN